MTENRENPVTLVTAFLRRLGASPFCPLPILQGESWAPRSVEQIVFLLWQAGKLGPGPCCDGVLTSRPPLETARRRPGSKSADQHLLARVKMIERALD